MLHILIYPSWYPTKEHPLSGVFIWEYARGLAKQGVQTTIAVCNVSYKDKSGITEEAVDGFRVIRICHYLKYHKFNKAFRRLAPRLYQWRNNRRLGKMLLKCFGKENKPQLIHAQAAESTATSVKYLAKVLKIPYVYTEHSTGFAENLYDGKQLKAIKKAFDGAKGIFPVSTNLMNTIKPYATNPNITVIPNAMSSEFCSEFKSIDYNQNQEFVFFTLSILSKRKNNDKIIKALKILLDKKYNVRLVIGGKGEEEQNLKNLAKELNIGHKVDFIGQLTSNVPSYFDKSHCFVFPSTLETFGIVTLESLSRGRPVIVSNTGAAQDLVNEKNGYIVDDPNDVQGFADCMARVIDNYSAYDGQQIQQETIEKYNQKKQVEKYIDIYKKHIQQ